MELNKILTNTRSEIKYLIQSKNRYIAESELVLQPIIICRYIMYGYDIEYFLGTFFNHVKNKHLRHTPKYHQNN